MACFLLRLGCLLLLAAGATPLRAEQVLFVASDIYAIADQETPPPGDTEAAEQLLAQIPAALAAENVALALRLATEAVHADSENATARRVLGYQRVTALDGNAYWCGGYAALMIERGNVWHPQFGWIKHKNLAHWQAGQRPWARRWINPEEDAQRHSTLSRGWTIRTDHFQVTTNHSRASGAELAVRLETLHQIWRQLFGEFDVSARELQARLDGKQPKGYRRKPFRVFYHRTRDEYNAELQRLQPQIGKTLGIYFDRRRETHFFAGDDQDPGTIYHEAVHQFFCESRPTGRQFGQLSNFWATEGIACYFESLQERKFEQGKTGPRATPRQEESRQQQPIQTLAFTLGTPDAGRLPAARHRRLVDNYYVPLAELSSLGILDLQRRSDLPMLYSQSAGLATFFMQYEEGKYARAFAKLLEAVYAGTDDVSTLQQVAGQPFQTLDREYAEFLEDGVPTDQKTTGVSQP